MPFPFANDFTSVFTFYVNIWNTSRNAKVINIFSIRTPFILVLKVTSFKLPKLHQAFAFLLNDMAEVFIRCSNVAKPSCFRPTFREGVNFPLYLLEFRLTIHGLSYHLDLLAQWRLTISPPSEHSPSFWVTIFLGTHTLLNYRRQRLEWMVSRVFRKRERQRNDGVFRKARVFLRQQGGVRRIDEGARKSIQLQIQRDHWEVSKRTEYRVVSASETERNHGEERVPFSLSFTLFLFFPSISNCQWDLFVSPSDHPLRHLKIEHTLTRIQQGTNWVNSGKMIRPNFIFSDTFLLPQNLAQTLLTEPISV